jgi:mutual gliding-motility protein MglA
MVFFNYSTMQMAAKIVYYGPGLCGKTTNLQYIYSHTANDSRGEMVSLETETDRTLFFDLLPIDVGSIAGFATRVQLYTVPGQVFYNTTRKLVLKGVDGVVFVADSQRPMLQANLDSFRNLEENLQEMGLAVESVPLVLQYNKRDLHDICSVEDLDRALNRGNWPAFETSALTGMGVFETLKGISKLTLLGLKRRLAKDDQRAAPSQASAPRPTPVPPASPAVPAATGKAEPPPAAAPRMARTAPAPLPAPAAVAVQAAPAPPAPAPARPKAAAPRPKTQSDVLAELEKIRRQALDTRRAPIATASPVPAGAPANGRHEISRDLQLTLERADFARARRFLLNLQVADGDNQAVDALRELQVDLGDLARKGNVVLHLNIALRRRD